MKLGGMQPMIAGAAAGALGQVATGYIGGYGHPVAAIGIGYLMKNNTLKVVGARDLGAMLAGNLTGGFGSGTGGAYQG